MPEHTLYYPEWNISDPTFLAESLLYWDRLACIVPDENFQQMPGHQDDRFEGSWPRPMNSSSPGFGFRQAQEFVDLFPSHRIA